MERICRVNRISLKSRSIGVGQCPINTPFLFSNASDGTIIMRQVDTTTFFRSTGYALESVTAYLAEVFRTTVSNTVRAIVSDVLNGVSVSSREKVSHTLFRAMEGVVSAKQAGDPSIASAFPKKPLPYTTRETLWRRVWSAITRTEGQLSFVKRYPHTDTNRLDIPSAILNMTSMTARQPVSVVERDDGSYLIRPIKAEEALYVREIRPVEQDGTVRGGRYLYLTKRQKAALGIGEEHIYDGINLKFTFDLVNEQRITVEPLTDEEADSIPVYGMGPRNYFDEVRVVQRHVKGPIILPAAFVKKYDIEKDDVLHTEIEGSKLHIYGKKRECSFCGTPHDCDELKTVPVCPGCADTLDDVKTTVAANGSIDAAVRETKRKLQNAMEMLNKLEEV